MKVWPSQISIDIDDDDGEVPNMGSPRECGEAEEKVEEVDEDFGGNLVQKSKVTFINKSKQQGDESENVKISIQ